MVVKTFHDCMSKRAETTLQDYLKERNLSKEEIITIDYSVVKIGTDGCGLPQYSTHILLVHN